MMGATLPAIERIAVPEPPPISALGGSSAAVLAAGRASRPRAAARYAVAQPADIELVGRAAARRTAAARAAGALDTAARGRSRQLDLALDESQREQAARARSARRRRDMPSR